MENSCKHSLAPEIVNLAHLMVASEENFGKLDWDFIRCKADASLQRLFKWFDNEYLFSIDQFVPRSKLQDFLALRENLKRAKNMMILDLPVTYDWDKTPIRPTEPDGTSIDIKPYYKIGDEVYVLLDPLVEDEKWEKAIIKGYNIVGVQNNGEIRTYTVEMKESGEFKGNLGEIYVKHVEDFQWEELHDLQTDMKGVEHYVDGKSKDQYLNTRGWFYACNKNFSTACDAMRAHDKAMVDKKNVLIVQEDLNFPQEWVYTEGRQPIYKVSSARDSISVSVSEKIKKERDRDTLSSPINARKRDLPKEPEKPSKKRKHYSEEESSKPQVLETICRQTSTFSELNNLLTKAKHSILHFHKRQQERWKYYCNDMQANSPPELNAFMQQQDVNWLSYRCAQNHLLYSSASEKDNILELFSQCHEALERSTYKKSQSNVRTYLSTTIKVFTKYCKRNFKEFLMCQNNTLENYTGPDITFLRGSWIDYATCEWVLLQETCTKIRNMI